jgi:transcriptional regulator with XRE-family HTH domain
MLQHITSTATAPPTMLPMGRGEPLPNLRRLRFAKGMRQQDLAEASGVNRTTIALIEAQGKAADVATAKKLAQALGVELADLLKGE